MGMIGVGVGLFAASKRHVGPTAALLGGEAQGFAANGTAVDPATAAYVKRTNLTPVLDDFLTNATTSPKYLPGAAGTLAWTAHNRALQSEAFSNASWNKNRSFATANVTTAPDGTATADKITEDTQNGVHLAYQIFTGTATSWTVSVFAKAGERTRVGLALYNGTSYTGDVYFNLSNGTIISTQAGSGTITSAGNGWYLCTVTAVLAAHVACELDFTLLLNDTTVSYVGDNVSGAYFWGGQLNLGTVRTDYLATTSAARYGTPIEFSPTSIGTRLGKRSEPAATNLLLQSQAFNTTWATFQATIAANDTAAPDGQATADRLTDNSNNSEHQVYQGITLASATAAAFSVYAKKGTSDFINLTYGVSANNYISATFNLNAGTVGQTGVGSLSGTIVATSIQDCGNGWYRCVLVGSVTGINGFVALSTAPAATGNTLGTGGSPTYIGSGTTVFIWQAQAELGSVATSPIPTFATTVTRAADIVFVNVAGNLPDVLSELTLLSQFIPSVRSNLGIAAVTDNSSNNRVDMRAAGPSGDLLYDVDSGGASQASEQTGGTTPYTVGTRARAILGAKTNDFAHYVNGTLIENDTAGSMPVTLTRLYIAALDAGTLTLNSLTEKLLLIPRKMSGAELAAASASDTFAALQAAETQGLFIDFTSATPITVKWVSAFHDPAQFFAFAGGSPKLAPRAVDGLLAYSPHNLLVQSENFTTGWTPGSTPVLTAHTIQDDGAQFDGAQQTVTLVAGGTYTFSSWVLKDAVTSRFPGFEVTGGASFIVHLNTQTGATAISDVGLSGTVLVEDAGAYWIIKLTFVTTQASNLVQIYGAISSVIGTNSAAAVGTVTIDKVQLNRGPIPTRYIRTTTAALYGLSDEHHPTTFAKLGWLVEPVATNLLLRSKEFNNAAWDATSNVTVVADQAVGPDGLTEADLVYPTSTGTARNIFQSVAKAASPLQYTFSIFAKRNNWQWILFQASDGGGNVIGKWFDIQNGVVGATRTVGVGWTLDASSIEALPNGWYRCKIIVTSNNAASVIAHGMLADADSSVTATTSGTNGVYLWGAQLELGSIASSPIPTFAAAVTRAADLYGFPLNLIPSLGSEYSVQFHGEMLDVALSCPWSISDGSTNNVAEMYRPAGGNPIMLYDRSGAVDQAEFPLGTGNLGATAFKSAGRFKLNDFHGAKDGVLAASPDTSGVLPISPTVFHLYDSVSATTNPRMRVTKIAIVPRAWDNGTLQAKAA